MNLELINIFMVMLFILVVLEFSNYSNNFIHVSTMFLVLTTICYGCGLWNSSLFEVNLWKMIFISLVLLAFFLILELNQENSFDVNCLLVLVFLGSVVLILSDNLLMLYLGLELQTFSIFILIAKNSSSIKSSEAGLKYFMLGAMSSGFFLLSIVMLFLNGLDLNLKHLLLLNEETMVSASLILITMSFCFKLSLFPFHFWIPDMYEGSSWDMITLVATMPKMSMICMLLQLILNSNLILMFSLLSMGMGTLGALNQSKVKSLLGYSGISHMGFIILGLLCMNKQGLIVGNLYLVVYMLSMLCLFIMILLYNIKNEYMMELGGMKFVNNMVAITFVLLMLSIAGIPPLSGFMSKWYLMWVVMENHFNFSSFIMIMFSAMGMGYYLSIVKIIYFQKKSSYFLWENMLKASESKSEVPILFLGFLFFMSLFLILNFSFMINDLNHYLMNLY